MRACIIHNEIFIARRAGDGGGGAGEIIVHGETRRRESKIRVFD